MGGVIGGGGGATGGSGGNPGGIGGGDGGSGGKKHSSHSMHCKKSAHFNDHGAACDAHHHAHGVDGSVAMSLESRDARAQSVSY